MKEFLNFIDVDYQEINIDENPDARKELEDLTGQNDAPVLSVGNEFVEAFDRELIVDVLEDNGIEVSEAPSPR